MVIETWHTIMVEISEVKLHYFEILHTESHPTTIHRSTIKVNHKVLGIFQTYTCM